MKKGRKGEKALKEEEITDVSTLSASISPFKASCVDIIVNHQTSNIQRDGIGVSGPTFPNGVKQLFLCAQLSNGVVSCHQFCFIGRWLKHVTPQEPRSHRSQGLIEDSKETMFGFR